jgi:hypothetical protein
MPSACPHLVYWDTQDNCYTGAPLIRAYLVKNLQAALKQAGLDDASYNGHSFWIGTAMTTAQQGLEDSLSTLLAGGTVTHSRPTSNSPGHSWLMCHGLLLGPNNN